MEGDAIISRSKLIALNFNPHLPCGRWQFGNIGGLSDENFNPHLPCGRWQSLSWDFVPYTLFQSTPSVWKVTWHYERSQKGMRISIHTFRVEGDSTAGKAEYKLCNFNPHLPCGRWHRFIHFIFNVKIFQSTPSVWKVTLCRVYRAPRTRNFNPHLPCGRWQLNNEMSPCTDQISIHTFRVEGDIFSSVSNAGQINFNPHLPCGRWRLRR